MRAELQQIEYFVSLLIESDEYLDLSNADDERVQEYHRYKTNMEKLKTIKSDLLDACKEALRETLKPGTDPLIKQIKAAIAKATE